MKFENYQRFVIMMETYIKLSLVTTEISNRQNEQIWMSPLDPIHFDYGKFSSEHKF